MIKIGITGGIGSGKSTACRMFEALGVPVYYADDRAKWLMTNDQNLIAALKGAFGPQVYLDNGNLDREYLGGLVFKDKAKLQLLNSIVHPAVFNDAEAWQNAKAKEGHTYTLKEAALLFESGSYKQLDRIVVVTAPEAIRIQRVMKRDQASKEEVLARINNQMPQKEKEQLADYLLENITLEAMEKAVQQLHQQLVKELQT